MVVTLSFSSIAQVLTRGVVSPLCSTNWKERFMESLFSLLIPNRPRCRAPGINLLVIYGSSTVDRTKPKFWEGLESWRPSTIRFHASDAPALFEEGVCLPLSDEQDLRHAQYGVNWPMGLIVYTHDKCLLFPFTGCFVPRISIPATYTKQSDYKNSSNKKRTLLCDMYALLMDWLLKFRMLLSTRVPNKDSASRC